MPVTIDQLVRDQAESPHLFVWAGRTSAVKAVAALVAETGVPAPTDLLQLWATTGGGELFESEELLPPLAGEDGFIERTLALRQRGLPGGLVAFHQGAWVSAFRGADPPIVALRPRTFTVIATFDNLADWYGHLRREYAERYGLAPTVVAPEDPISTPGQAREELR